ncbi:LysE family translocator [Nocardiopsis coralliicola]
MPLPEHLAGFIAAGVLVTVLPGPDFILITRNTVRAGRTAGWATAAGSVTGLAAWSLLSAAGLAVLLAEHPEALFVLRIAGAAYLLYLGLSALAGVLRARRRSAAADAAAAPPPRGGPPYAQGVLNNLLNPKVPAVFVTIVPQFVSHPEAAAFQTAVLGAALIGISIAWWSTYVTGIGALSAFLQRRRVRQTLDTAGAVGLTGFGLALALSAV